MLKKYDDLGWKRWMRVLYPLRRDLSPWSLTVEPPEGVDAGKFYLFVSLLDWKTTGHGLHAGRRIGAACCPSTISGMDFGPDASVRGAVSGAAAAECSAACREPIGIACAVVALLVCGPDNLVIPSYGV